MKKLIVGAVLALAVAAFLPRAASAGIWENGIWQNGIWENGNWSNGNWSNGIWENGVWGNGIWDNGALLQGGERLAGPLCTERRVDLSAVPLAKVTVRLPQPMG
jgi:hypothetical protein